MPEPPQQTPQSIPRAVAPPPSSTVKGRQNSLVFVGIGGVIVVLAAVVAFLALHKNSPSASQTPESSPITSQTPATPVAQTPPPVQTPPPAAADTTPPSAPKPVATAPGTLDQPRAIWTFDQDNGNVVIDTTGNGYNADVVGDQSAWIKATNPDGSGLRLGGSNYVEVAGAVVNTAQSFSVAARVSLDLMESKKYQTFVSIDGKEISGFYLQFNPYAGGGAGRFEFDRMESDAKTATKISAKAKASISTNTWYQLVGVYDADAQDISIYLNGKLQETVPYTGGWQAAGKTAIGRGRISGHSGNFLNGIIRDVRFYAFALTADQVKKIAK